VSAKQIEDIVAVVLAAGRGTRMKSEMLKAMVPLCGLPLIRHIVDALKASGIKRIVVVTGYKKELLEKALDGLADTVHQKTLLGSGDAAKTAMAKLKNFKGHVLIVPGDVPLFKPETITSLVERHKRGRSDCTLLTIFLSNPGEYGRIFRSITGSIEKIIEKEDLAENQSRINEINTGLYCFKAKALCDALEGVKKNSKKGEYFLTDTIEILHEKGCKIDSLLSNNTDEMLGVNSQQDYSRATQIMKNRILDRLMSSGVTVVDPASTSIDKNVKIMPDTIVYPHTTIEKDVNIAGRCKVGPYAHLREGVQLDEGAEVGNFAELVRTRVGEGTKIKHQVYIGDAVIGKDVNIGAGTIIANYDGKNKYITRIGDGAFIGSGTVLVAPVKIGAKAVTGAGCVVTKGHDVPAGAVVVGVPARKLEKNKKKRGGR